MGLFNAQPVLREIEATRLALESRYQEVELLQAGLFPQVIIFTCLDESGKRLYVPCSRQAFGGAYLALVQFLHLDQALGFYQVLWGLSLPGKGAA